MRTSLTPSIFNNADAYKLSHARQYPDRIENVISNFTPRTTRFDVSPLGLENEMVWFGIQYFLKNLELEMKTEFFDLLKQQAVENFKKFYERFFGTEAFEDDLKRIEELWDYQAIPLKFYSLPEGTKVKPGTPTVVFYATDPKFFWFTNWIETWMSIECWYSSTSASISYYYSQLASRFLQKTNPELAGFNLFQNHDFSMRGMTSRESARVSGAAHLLSSRGTDTTCALEWIDTYYPGSPEEELLGTSIVATEHSVMSAGGMENEKETFERLLSKVYPSGFISIVSDTWDFWKVVTETIPEMKDLITSREGKLVLRPDSSPKTPVEIICGDPRAKEGSAEYKGLIESLWDIFGGSISSTGYKCLAPCIGAIYGDSITLQYFYMICTLLEKKGFASSNIVFGVGSFTYQYVTRDTFGIAIKATAAVFDGKLVDIYKDPKTDNGIKKSLVGLHGVTKTEKGLIPKKYSSIHEFETDVDNELKLIFENTLLNTVSFTDVRKVLHS